MSEQNVEFVKSIYGAFAQGDVPTVLGAFADDIEWSEATEDVEGFAITPEELIGSGANVVSIVRYTGTGKATGKALDVPVVHVWEIRDGKLARFRQFIDTVKFAEVVPAV